MTAQFDPYHKWLGIPPTDQPPNHYRLLGVETFETDTEVIESAADQRMAFLRTFQTGKHGPESQRLLNEVSKARICLTNSTKKVDYDRELSQQIKEAEVVVAEPYPTDNPTIRSSVPNVTRGRVRTNRNAKSNRRLISIVLGLLSIFILGTIVLFFTGIIPNFLSQNGTVVDNGPVEEQTTTIKTDEFEKDPSNSIIDVTPIPTETDTKPIDTKPIDMIPLDPLDTTNPIDSLPITGPTKPTDANQTSDQPKPPKPDSGTGVSPKTDSPTNQPKPEITEDDRFTLPPGIDQEKSFAELDEQYHFEEITSRQKKVELAREFLELSVSEKDPIKRYVMLTQSLQYAVQNQAIDDAINANLEISKNYQVDAWQSRASLLIGLADVTTISSKVRQLIDQSLQFIDEAVENGHMEEAIKVCDKMYTGLKGGTFKTEFNRMQNRWIRLIAQQQDQQAYTEGLVILESAPMDPKANLDVGRWLCFVRNDWENGLRHLALGEEPSAKLIAELELKQTNPNLEQKIALGDKWWELSSEVNDQYEGDFKLRAGFWYESVREQMTEAESTNFSHVARRLTQINALVAKKDSGQTDTREKKNPKGADLVATNVSIESKSGRFKFAEFFQNKTRIVVATDGLISAYELPTGKRVGEISIDDTSHTESISLSPNGTHIAITGKGIIQVWNIESERMIGELSQGRLRANTAFTDNGNVIVATKEMIMSVNVETQEKKEFRMRNDMTPGTMRFHPNGLFFGQRNEIMFIASSNQKQQSKSQPLRSIDNTDPVTDIEFSHDGEALAICRDTDRIAYWLNVGEPLLIKGIDAPITDVSFLNKRMLAGVNQNELRIWNLATRKSVFDMEFDSPISQPLVAGSKDGLFAAVTVDPRTIQIYSVNYQ